MVHPAPPRARQGQPTRTETSGWRHLLFQLQIGNKNQASEPFKLERVILFSFCILLPGLISKTLRTTAGPKESQNGLWIRDGYGQVISSKEC